MSIISLKLVTS